MLSCIIYQDRKLSKLNTRDHTGIKILSYESIFGKRFDKNFSFNNLIELYWPIITHSNPTFQQQFSITIVADVLHKAFRIATITILRLRVHCKCTSTGFTLFSHELNCATTNINTAAAYCRVFLETLEVVTTGRVGGGGAGPFLIARYCRHRKFQYLSSRETFFFQVPGW